jgi:hypothetical protein
VHTRELELLRLDVDAEQLHAPVLLPKHREHGADTAAHLEQPRPGLERSAVADQPMAPVLCLLDEPLLLGRSVAVDIGGHRSSLVSRALGGTAQPCDRTRLSE